MLEVLQHADFTPEYFIHVLDDNEDVVAGLTKALSEIDGFKGEHEAASIRALFVGFAEGDPVAAS